MCSGDGGPLQQSYSRSGFGGRHALALEEMTRPDIEAITMRAEAATKGPWAWRGYTDSSIELRGLHSGGIRIVSTMRAEPCVVETIAGSITLTAGACDSCKAEMTKKLDPFVEYQCPKPENLDTIWLQDPDGFIRPANQWAMREVPYRNDVASIAHPDAHFIAAARSDVPALLAYIAELEDQARGGRTVVDENVTYSDRERWEKGLWP